MSNDSDGLEDFNFDAVESDSTFVPNPDDYTLVPYGAEWTEPACPGSVGSQRLLSDIELQAAERASAYYEHRQERVLAIHCPFCGKFHIEMQPPVFDIVGGDTTSNPPVPGEPPTEPPTDPGN